MPYMLEDLVVDRVDLVNEGANSAAFIEIAKRKETKEPMDFSEIISKMKPEHAEVVQSTLDGVNAELAKAREDLDAANSTIAEQGTKLEEANDALAKANEELETLKAASGNCTCEGEADDNGVCKACGKVKKSTSFDEAEVLKAMPENIRNEYLKMRAQKEAAEEQVRKDAAEKLEAEAVAKAATLKSLPVSQDILVEVIKKSDKTVIDLLSTVAAAIDGTVLSEVGKSGEGKSSSDAWSRLEAEADKIASRDSVTKQKAIGIAIKEHPELYREYLNGGNN